MLRVLVVLKKIGIRNARSMHSCNDAEGCALSSMCSSIDSIEGSLCYFLDVYRESLFHLLSFSIYEHGLKGIGQMLYKLVLLSNKKAVFVNFVVFRRMSNIE